MLVGYFLFLVLTQFKQIERSILYKLDNSLVNFGAEKLLFLFKLEEEESFNSKLMLEDVSCLIFSKFLFLPSMDLLVVISFELKKDYIKMMINIIIFVFTLFNDKFFLYSLKLSLSILFINFVYFNIINLLV